VTDPNVKAYGDYVQELECQSVRDPDPLANAEAALTVLMHSPDERLSYPGRHALTALRDSVAQCRPG
jgi:hypothetical protein